MGQYVRYSKETVTDHLIKTGGSVKEVADSLKVSEVTIYKYVRKYGIEHLRKRPKWRTTNGVEEAKELYKKCRGNISRMALEVGISRQAMTKRMQHPELVTLKEEFNYPKNILVCEFSCSLEQEPERFIALYKKFYGNYTKIAREYGFTKRQLTPFIRQLKLHGMYKRFPPTRNRVGITEGVIKRVFIKYNGKTSKMAKELNTTTATICKYVNKYIKKTDNSNTCQKQYNVTPEDERKI